MSIIVAVRRNGRITMAADTLALFGEGMTVPEYNARACKIIRVGDAVVGGTGWAVYDDILDHYLSGGEPPALDSRRAIYAFFVDFWRALKENYALVNEQAASKDTPFGDLDATFLVAGSGGLFQVSSDMGVTEFKAYHAIGSGAEYALGVMHALRDRERDDESLVQAACWAAMEMDAHCGGSIDTRTVDCPTG